MANPISTGLGTTPNMAAYSKINTAYDPTGFCLFPGVPRIDNRRSRWAWCKWPLVLDRLKPGAHLMEYSCKENNKDRDEGHLRPAPTVVPFNQR
jgi:hypothetical protein